MATVLGQHHFDYLAYGERWEAVGDALRAAAPACAALAYDHAEAQYVAYDREWTAHLPASRFDADGGAWLAPLRVKQDALAAAGAPGAPTSWVESLCAGTIEAALAAYERAPGEDGDGLDPAGRKAAHALLAAHAARLGLTDACVRHRDLANVT